MYENKKNINVLGVKEKNTHFQCPRDCSHGILVLCVPQKEMRIHQNPRIYHRVRHQGMVVPEKVVLPRNLREGSEPNATTRALTFHLGLTHPEQITGGNGDEDNPQKTHLCTPQVAKRRGRCCPQWPVWGWGLRRTKA